MKTDKAVDVQKVSKKYGDFKVLDEISFDVLEGSVFGLIGPNGAGKTTLIKLLMGMVKPDKGVVKVVGNDLKYNGKLTHNIGYVPETCNLYGYMNLKEVISFAKGFYEKWNSELVDRYIDFFQLPSNVKVDKFSKGMKVKASLILAMAHDPDLLILDEPTSGLDPIARRDFLNVVMEEITLSGKTVIFSSHIIDDVERVAEKVVIIDKGRLIKVKNIDEIKTNEKIIRVVFQGKVEPEFFEYPGIEKVETKGSSYLITVSENFDEIYQRCKDRPTFTIEIIDQSLEEILIDRGTKGGKQSR